MRTPFHNPEPPPAKKPRANIAGIVVHAPGRTSANAGLARKAVAIPEQTARAAKLLFSYLP